MVGGQDWAQLRGSSLKQKIIVWYYNFVILVLPIARGSGNTFGEAMLLIELPLYYLQMFWILSSNASGNRSPIQLS